MGSARITELLRRARPMILTVQMLIFAPFTLPAMPPRLPEGIPDGAQDGGGSESMGRSLFAGTLKLRNGGPPCRSCHSIAGIPFPNGGTLGPDLTMIIAKLGPQGIGPTLQTLYFPTMTPIFDEHPLTLQEQSDLKAFFRQAGSERPPQQITPLIVALATAGFVLLLILTRAIWPHRLHGVRKNLLTSVREGPQS